MGVRKRMEKQWKPPPPVPTLLALLCDAIVQQLNPDKDYAEDELLPLAKGLLGLIDTLCCVATGDMVPS